jgi:hypothetical protein
VWNDLAFCEMGIVVIKAFQWYSVVGVESPVSKEPSELLLLLRVCTDHWITAHFILPPQFVDMFKLFISLLGITRARGDYFCRLSLANLFFLMGLRQNLWVKSGSQHRQNNLESYRLQG